MKFENKFNSKNEKEKTKTSLLSNEPFHCETSPHSSNVNKTFFNKAQPLLSFSGKQKYQQHEKKSFLSLFSLHNIVVSYYTKKRSTFYLQQYQRNPMSGAEYLIASSPHGGSEAQNVLPETRDAFWSILRLFFFLSGFSILVKFL
ncbi:hypothetical protein NPIL_378051 [Nephila pilipes]|uniref:Uncharacterized protein n=1 Tax=Nephila pilipes TaxID=299642 RepID=A0A8X6UER5_NEPPI|nr:hypothetical protein NPIL_378051 [Nephila pilipes]